MRTGNAGRYLTVGFGGVLLAGLLTVVVPTTVAPEAAQARCSGGTEVRSTLVYNGYDVVSERPAAGTCNRNGLYSGRLRSHFSSWIAEVWIQNDGSWRHVADCWYHQDGCDYSYSDPNSYSYIHFCTRYPDDDGHYRSKLCGWGTRYVRVPIGSVSHRYYGVNQGF